jgi:hypothetical protein
LQTAVVAAAVALGLAGSLHCAAMCGAPCAALVGRSAGAAAAFHAARVAGYAGAGALAAAGLASLGALAQAAPALRMLWVLAHSALFALGLWLLWQGRQPALLARIGRPSALTATVSGSWQPLRMAPAGAPAPPKPQLPWRAAAGGALWFAWPCGLVQSALLVAALASSATEGAAAMAGFALASSPGLVAAPLAWRWIGRAGARAERWALRAAGLLILAMSGWALTQGLWHRVAAYCATLL